VIAGTNVTLTIGALGSLPLSWQWHFNGSALRDATNSGLTLAAVTTNQAGNYFVVITNSLGSTTSQVAVLTVLPGLPPSITLQPFSQTVSAGGWVTFNAAANGFIPFYWQWLFKGKAIPDATNSSLTLPAVTVDQAGVYTVVVSNIVGSATSVDATLTVRVPGTKYVWQNSPSPAPPYSSWATAARAIQDAVDAAVPGDGIMVTNGVYAGITVTKPLALLGVNGPRFTVIDGGGTNRCVSAITNILNLSGFTLTNGAAQYGNGGGVFCYSGFLNGFLTNCVLVGNSTYSGGGGAYGAALFNCTLTNNRADGALGGGAQNCTLYNCALAGNSATNGGAAESCTLYNCTLTRNTNGGAMNSTLYNCALTSNSNGGALDSTLYNCTLTANTSFGGAAFWCKLYNCILYLNPGPGGTNYDASSTLNFCCTTPLPASGLGNITNDPALAGPWRLSSSSPCRGAGSAAYASGVDLDGEPWLNPPSIGCDEFYSESLTGALSMTITASWTNIATGFAITLNGAISGRPSESRWEFGDGTVESNRLQTTYQWLTAGDYDVVLRAYNNDYPDGTTTNLTIHVVERPVHYVDINSTNSIAPYTSWGTAATNIQNAVDASPVPGMLVLVSNGLYRVGGRSVDMSAMNRLAVTTPLTVQSVNGPQATIIQGYQVPSVIFGSTAVRCVSLCSDAVLSGFTLTNGAGPSGGGIWCQSSSAVVTNCTLSGNSASNGGGGVSGGTLYNCKLSGNSAPSLGGGGADGSTLNNCILTGNSGVWGPGGAFGGVLNNCILIGNSANNAGGATFATLNNCTLAGNQAQNGGGGAYGSTLNNCLLTNNTAFYSGGGGAENCTLNNCTLTGNTSSTNYGYAGGAYASTLNNCIVYFNSAPDYSESTLNYCCTTPLPANGVGNITNAPLFVSPPNGDFRLQADSPCINAGNNTFATGSRDLDGNPRIVGAMVDIGAYEFQNPGSVISLAWLQQWNLPTDGSADYADPDGDGMNNWQEWIAGTNPTNALSCLRLLSATSAGGNLTVSWQSVAGVNYFLQRSANLGSPFTLVLTNILRTGTNIVLIGTNSVVLGTNIVGQGGITTYIDTNTIGAGPFFYRVGVNGP
jgi:hypothetical protein